MLQDRLYQLRTKNGYTKKYVGEFLRMTPEGYGYYENGNRKPSPETLTMLAELYNVTTDYLLCVSDSPLPPTKKHLIAYDDEAVALMDEMRSRPEMRTLFSVSQKATKADIEAINEILKRMVEREENPLE